MWRHPSAAGCCYLELPGSIRCYLVVSGASWTDLSGANLNNADKKNEMAHGLPSRFFSALLMVGWLARFFFCVIDGWLVGSFFVSALLMVGWSARFCFSALLMVGWLSHFSFLPRY